MLLSFELDEHAAKTGQRGERAVRRIRGDRCDPLGIKAGKQRGDRDRIESEQANGRRGRGGNGVMDGKQGGGGDVDTRRRRNGTESNGVEGARTPGKSGQLIEYLRRPDRRGRSKELATELATDFEAIGFLEGGFLAWEAEQLPIERPD